MANGIFAHFTMLTAVTEPLVCTRAGATYLYQWSEVSNKDDLSFRLGRTSTDAEYSS